MATREHMQAVYETRMRKIPSIEHLVRNYQEGWERVQNLVRDTARFVVVVPKVKLVQEQPRRLFPNNVSRWLDENVGPEAMNSYSEDSPGLCWMVGAWDWYPMDDDIKFYFIDQTDAAAFRIRWA